MIARLLLLAAALPVTSFAQLQIYQFDGTNETPIGTSYTAGPVAAGDSLDMRFRVRNSGSAAVTIQSIAISGQGFKIAASPTLPYILAPGQPVDFRVDFSAPVAGIYNATVSVNSVAFSVQASAVVAPALFLDSASTPLGAGATIDFGAVPRGSSKMLGFHLLNTGSTNLKVSVISVTGSGFQGPMLLSAPVIIGPAASVPFQVAFAPQAAQSAQGSLMIDQRSFQLTGVGLDPALPSASIVFDTALPPSGEQVNVSIPLSAPSQVPATGTLTLAFSPAVAGVADDPAVQFLSGPLRTATVTISPGDSAGKFNGQTSLAFQTGSTAGTISFKLNLSNGTEQQASITIAPASINIETTTAVPRAGNLDISITAIDNTYSASLLAFTFFDSKGNTLAPGTIRVDETSAFHSYFTAGQGGGAFSMRATFPVAGDVTKVAAVQVQMTNSAGSSLTPLVRFY